MAMLGVSDPWVLLGLFAFSLVVTLASNWLVARLRRPASTKPGFLGSALASLLWILIVFASGVVATRYIERITNATSGYVAFGLVALAMSLIRAALYQQVYMQQQAESVPAQLDVLGWSLHNALYLLFPFALYLALAWLVRRPANPVLFIPLGLGALLADLDSQTSVAGRVLPLISRQLEIRFGHLQEWHTPVGAALVALVSAPLILAIGLQAWMLIPLGFISHLVLDTLDQRGIMLFWPFTRTRYSTFGGPIISPGNSAERRLLVGLAAVVIVLLFVVDIGTAPPPPAVVPSYEQTFERYYALRGRNLVFADVEGTWQASGRRMTARFEILNAYSESFIMLDRFTGRVFTAGRTATDNLYLNRITLQAGAVARAKPVEVHLEDQLLGEALPILYQMQREPGLQHIFVSGDVLLARQESPDSASILQADLAQESLRKIQVHDGGQHYSLHYLVAGELIELANLNVEIADLVIVATYASPATGPTPTPLPSPPPATSREAP